MILQSFNLIGSAIKANTEERVTTILRITRKQTLLTEVDLIELSQLGAWDKLEMVSQTFESS